MISGVVTAVGALFTGVVVHELAHLGWVLFSVGRLPLCDSGLPVRLGPGMLWTCTAFVSSPGMLLAGPVAGGLFGIGLILASPRLDTGPTRDGLFVSGTVFWLYNTLYGLGWIHPVILRDGEPVLAGDGVAALAHLGYPALLPGGALLVIGIAVLCRRLEYRE